MKNICASRMVWRHIFLKSLGNYLPKPFFLPKPLKKTSSEDIESAIRGWISGWTPSTPLQHFIRHVDRAKLGGEKLLLETVIVAPGGRWAIAGSTTGSVWWFDLSDDWTSTSPIEPRILINSTLNESETTLDPHQVKIAADFSSNESLGSSDDTHHLSQFNVAVVVCPTEPSSPSPARVGVWRVQVIERPGNSGLKVEGCLSAYTEAGTAMLTDFSILGSTLAYGVDTKGGCVVIVDWAEANGKTADDEIVRRYIPLYPTSVRALTRKRMTRG